MNNDIYSQGKEIQKRIILTKMTTILGQKYRAIAWMNTLREEFDDITGAWHTANEAIYMGQYDRVLAEVTRIDWGVY